MGPSWNTSQNPPDGELKRFAQIAFWFLVPQLFSGTDMGLVPADSQTGNKVQDPEVMALLVLPLDR